MIKNKRKKDENLNEIIRYYPKFNEGLKKEEVESRINYNLVNKEKVKISQGYLSIITKNIFTFFNMLLLAIGIILIISGNISSCAFLVILLLNLSIGLYQDIKAKIALDKLSLIEKEKIRVIRDKKEELIDSNELVLDDVYIINKNIKIPCDSLILNGEGMIDESLLTGESLPQKKSIGDEVLSGTYLINGELIARVLKVGNDNYISKVQIKSKKYKKPKSKMFIQLNRLFKILSVIVIVIGLFQIGEFLYFFLKEDFSFTSYSEKIITLIPRIAGSLISMIPSGMYLLISTTLVVGVINLAKNKVLIKDMYSQETLARVNYLCMDKTGTLTDGNMSVYDYVLFDKNLDKDRFEAYISSYCSKLGDDNYTSFCLKNYFKSKKIFKVLSYIPFSSVYKYSAVSLEEVGTIVIGAPNFININKDSYLPYESYFKKEEEKGLRVLVVGISKENIKDDKLPKDINLLAMILIQDHIREEALESIKWFNENNVNIKIISGDNPSVASIVASRCNVKDADKFISLEGIKNEQIIDLVDKYVVFGRVNPTQKELIIKALRKNGNTVAMVGDGINDCLALKSADVSISLESGAKATKDISSFLLLENNFTKLSNVVNEGRRVINNLERTCSLFLTKTIFSILVNLFFLIFALTLRFNSNDPLWPFSPNSFYSWELITIGIAAFLLALESNSTRINGNFLKNILKKALPHGIIIGLLIIILYSLGGVLDLDNIKLLNIATFIISIGSFIPLFDVSKPFNPYRTLVFGLSIILSSSLIIWSVFGFNWLIINGTQSVAPRFISNKEIYIILISIGIYILIYLIYILIKSYKKHGKDRRKN